MLENLAQTGRLRVLALGQRAADALAQSTGNLQPIPGFEQTPYRLAGEEIVWVGTHGQSHPRAVFVQSAPNGETLEWNAHLTPLALTHTHAGLNADAVRRNFLGFARRCTELGEPRGLGRLLAGSLPPFPLDLRADSARRLAAAAGNGDIADFVASAMRLLGVGGGLTPSGDDFVGAALFTLYHLHPGAAHWESAAGILRAAVRTRSHVISAALFADLSEGASFASLHELLDAAGASAEAMLEPARRLTAIGHSSGWDMFAGMVAAATGTLQHITL